MIKYALLVSIISFTYAAQADIFKCWFNNPFIAVTYSMAQQEVTVYSGDGNPQTVRGISFHVRSAVNFELKQSDKVVMKLKLSRVGHDGDTTYSYPYESVWNGKDGVCESNFLRRKE